MDAGRQIVVISEAFHSGSGSYLQGLVNELSLLEPVVLLSPRHETESRFLSTVGRFLLPRIDELRPKFLKALGMQYQTFCRIWQALRLRPHTSTYLVLFPGNIFFALQLLALLRLVGARIVLNVHDVRPHVRQAGFLPASVEHWLFCLCYRMAHHIVVLTRASADEMGTSHGVAHDRVSIVAHGAFSLTDKALPLPEHPGRFLVFGALRENKSIFESISAVQALRRNGELASLIIAGQPQEKDYRENCKRLIATAPDGIDVHEGYLASSDLPALFAGCSALLLPYRDFTSQSGVAVMSVISGRSIVAVPTGGINELFEAGSVGVMIDEPVNTESISAALRSFMSSPIEPRYVDVIAVGDRLKKKLSWPVVAAEFRRCLTAMP
jgi:glycosyltransferase involved in cell wall biosynthesis